MNPPTLSEQEQTVETIYTVFVCATFAHFWQRHPKMNQPNNDGTTPETRNIRRIADTLRTELCLLDTENYEDYE